MADFITPISRIGSIEATPKSKSIQNVNDSSIFKDIFNDAINSMTQTTNQVEDDALGLVTGVTSDDLHGSQIDITQAQLATSLVIQLRNRVMDAYNEIMRMNL